LFLLLAIVLTTSSAWAQVGANVGGVVRDNTGAVIPGATVNITNTNTGGSQVLKTGSEGNYRAVNLQPAAYDITAEASGFGTVKKAITLLVGSDVAVDFSLGVAGVSENITVTGEVAALVEVTKSAPSSVVDNQQLAALPVLNRNFLVVAQTMPGAASMQNLAVTTRFAVTKFGGVADQRNGYTTIIDGAPIDDATWGTPVINMSQDSVQEFKTYRNQFDAQYGHAMNAVVNVITRSGGDHLHGTAYYFGRDAALNARNALASATPPFNQTRAGGTFGGPLFSSSTHFFGAFEYLNTDTAAVVALPPSNPFATQQNGNYPYTVTEKFGDVKVDHSFSASNAFYVRYAYDSQYTPSGGPSNSTAQIDNSIAHSIVLEDNWVISPTTVNTIRYTFLHHNLFTLPVNYNVGISRPDYSFGQNNVDPQYFPRTNHYLTNTFFINKAKHDIKIGGELTKAYSTYQAHYYEHGLFTFTTDAPFDANNPATWPQSFVQETPGNFSDREWNIGVFVQDDWRILPNLRLNLGFRYDVDTNLRDNNFYRSLLNNALFAGINHFVSNNRGNDYTNGLQPRFGFAWDFKGNGKLVIRGGFGKYTSRMRPWFVEQAEQQTFGASVRITNPQQLLHFPDITAVLNGQSLASYVANGGARAIDVLANDFRLPYSLNFTFGFGWQVNRNSSLSVDLVHDHSLNEIGTSDKNLPATGVVNAANPRPVPQFTQVAEVVNNGQARYDALEIQYRTRVKGFEALSVSYTYSRSMINAVTFYSTYTGTDRTPQNYAYNPTDTPHNLSVAFSSAMLPGKFQVSGIFRGVSGGPLPVSAGFDLDGDLNVSNDRPHGLPQTVGHGNVIQQLALINAFRANPCSFTYYPGVTCTAKPQPAVLRSLLSPQPVIDLDLRLSKIIVLGEARRLELFFEGYNVTNHVTKYGGASSMTSPAFLIRTTALDARQLQWGARFTF
jgi:hypothetical protein